jgi:Ca2+-binding RTX toxin-like protein
MDGVNWTAAREYGWSGWEVVNSAEGQSVSGVTHTATAGNNTLTGSAGSDRFVYSSVNDGLDTIVDFEFGSWGDTLNISEVLQGYVPGSSNPASFVRLTESAGNVTVSVNADGIGSDFVALATLQGVTGALLNDMLAQGNLVLS